MARKDAKRVADKWSRRLADSEQDYVDGVNAVTTAPGESAARAEKTFRARVVKSIDDGTWAKNVKAVGLSDWQGVTSKDGARHLVEAATSKKDNTQNFQEGWLEYTQQASDKIKGMANVTDADREKRMLENLKLMRAGKGKYSKRK